jgi:hypothetical protein
MCLYFTGKLTNHNIKICNKSFENEVNSEYLGTIVSNRNYARDTVKNILNPGGLLQFSSESFVFPFTIQKPIAFLKYKTVICLFYVGVKVCLILREEHKLQMFEDKVLRRIFGPKRVEETGG